ncbi:MAG: plasmid recombination protein [Clostridium sp.]|nr:plasmid recombination protein [Clostridium sp.]
MIFISELAYSLHLGSDKNRKNVSKEKAKTNNSGTTSLPNSAIQNASHLTRVDKHNYRKYDNKSEDIVIVRGTTSLVDDVKNLYKQEFQKSVDEYNSIQVREDRKIKDYFTNVSNNTKNDLACEIIIELGNKKYWDTKDKEFKRKITFITIIIVMIVKLILKKM